MSILRIVSRYATSLFDLSKAEGQLDQVHEEVMNAWDVVKHDDFKAFLKSPVISVTKKKKVLESVFDKFDKNLLNTFLVMATHKREAFIGDFCRAFHCRPPPLCHGSLRLRSPTRGRRQARRHRRTSSAPPSAPRSPPASCPTTCRSARPARSSPRSSISPWASAAPSSTWRA